VNFGFLVKPVRFGRIDMGFDAPADATLPPALITLGLVPFGVVILGPYGI